MDDVRRRCGACSLLAELLWVWLDAGADMSQTGDPPDWLCYRTVTAPHWRNWIDKWISVTVADLVAATAQAIPDEFLPTH